MLANKSTKFQKTIEANDKGECSHNHTSEFTVHQGSAIEVIIPEICFIIFHCGIVHCETLSWFICSCEYSSITRMVFTIVNNLFHQKHEMIARALRALCL